MSVCEYGLTDDEVRDATGVQYDVFGQWMRGQTMAVCDGRRYNHETREYESTGCGPHGPVVFPWDLDRFLAGLPVID